MCSVYFTFYAITSLFFDREFAELMDHESCYQCHGLDIYMFLVFYTCYLLVVCLFLDH